MYALNQLSLQYLNALKYKAYLQEGVEFDKNSLLTIKDNLCENDFLNVGTHVHLKYIVINHISYFHTVSNEWA